MRGTGERREQQQQERQQQRRATRRRCAARVTVEALDARQLLAGGVAPALVGFQEDGSTGRQVLIITGTNQADTIQISDNGTASPGNITVTTGTGHTYTTTTPVTQIDLVTKGGDDQVTYNLTGDLVSPRVVLTDLGAGNDRFTDNLNGAINNATGLDIETYGDAGNDTMTSNQSGAVLQGQAVVYFEGDAGNDTLTHNDSSTIAAGATLSPESSGGAGNDTIRTSYAGVLNGTYMSNLVADGGAGNDTIATHVQLAAGSTGVVGSSSAAPAAIVGGAGNDALTFDVAVDPTINQGQIYAIAIGGSGRDKASLTKNVLTDKTNETTVRLS